MENVDKKRVNYKTTVLEELEYWNVIFVFRRIKLYYRNKLKWMKTKELQGLEADDFAMTVMVKIISEDISWQRSTKNSFMDFVYETTRGEWSHFLVASKNKTFISFDDDLHYKPSDNKQLVDHYMGF